MAAPVFDLDAALSGSPKQVGEVQWVSADPIAVESIGRFDQDPEKAIVVAAGHGVKKGDRVFLGGFDFMVDGYYVATDHPMVEQRAIAFAIDVPEALGDRLLRAGKLYRPVVFKVWYPDHLNVDGTLELKKLQMDRVNNLQAQAKYQSVAESFAGIAVAVTKLAESVGVKPEDQAKFRERLDQLASVNSESLLTQAIESIKKEFEITDKGFDKKVKALSREIAKMAESVHIDAENFTEAFGRRAIALEKREIEILCHMPYGLMSALDNMPRMEDVLRKIYAYVSDAIDEASKADTAGNGPEPEKS